MAVTFDDFKPIRNRIRKLNADSLLLLAIQKLHDTRYTPAHELEGWLPWNLLLIVKWTLQHGEFNASKEPSTSKDLAKLMNMIHAFGDRGRMPSEFSSLQTFMKSMAFQQFWLQENITVAEIGRQVQLFRRLGKHHAIEEIFEDSTGVRLDAFLDLAFMLLSPFLSDKPTTVVSSDYFGPVAHHYPAGTIDRFFELLSLTPQTAKAFLDFEDCRVHDFDARLYEQTPLRRKPLLKVPSGYICYSPRVLFSGVGTIVYDLLKDRASQRFTDEFGNSFEQYLRLGLRHLGHPVIDEKTLQKRFGGRKAVDFLLPFSDANVMLESKAIELSPLARVSPDVKVVNSHLQSSVVKAIKQGLATASQLRTSTIPNVASAADAYLLVVTFKDLYLGRGRAFVVEDVASEIAQFAAAEGFDPSVLPPEHIYFLSVEEFEWLIAASKDTGTTIPTILRAAVSADRSPETSKFSIGKHLEAQFSTRSVPSFAREPFDEFCAEIAQKLGESSTDVSAPKVEAARQLRRTRMNTEP